MPIRGPQSRVFSEQARGYGTSKLATNLEKSARDKKSPANLSPPPWKSPLSNFPLPRTPPRGTPPRCGASARTQRKTLLVLILRLDRNRTCRSGDAVAPPKESEFLYAQPSPKPRGWVARLGALLPEWTCSGFCGNSREDLVS
jgi:hypothetical protein